jgi:hypothetical protein
MKYRVRRKRILFFIYREGIGKRTRYVIHLSGSSSGKLSMLVYL